MKRNPDPVYYLVKSTVVPEVYRKVSEAKEYLACGEARTIEQATERAGISRSAFYKYKDAISLFRDYNRNRILTFHATLVDKDGVLAQFLMFVASSGAGIVTINQSVPRNGAAFLTLALVTDKMRLSIEDFMEKAKTVEGVLSFYVQAG